MAMVDQGEAGGGRDKLALLLERNAAVVVGELRRAPGGPRSPMSALTAARTSAEVIEDVTRQLVLEARAAGHTWQEIGGLLRTSRQAAQQRFGGEPMDTVNGEFEPLARRAAEIIEQLRTADWEGLTVDWDETMHAKLPVAQVAEVWAGLTGSAGELQAVGRPSIVRRGPYRIADLPLVFEHGPMKARVTFNHDDTVAGLWILLPDAD